MNFKTATEMFTKGTVILHNCRVAFEYVPHSRGASSGYSHSGPGEEGDSWPGRRGAVSRGEDGRRGGRTAACF